MTDKKIIYPEKKLQQHLSFFILPSERRKDTVIHILSFCIRCAGIEFDYVVYIFPYGVTFALTGLVIPILL